MFQIKDEPAKRPHTELHMQLKVHVRNRRGHFVDRVTGRKAVTEARNGEALSPFGANHSDIIRLARG
jgi:hypothetical protein